MKINLNTLQNKKIIYPVAFGLLILWISILLSKTNVTKQKNTNTFPILDNQESTNSGNITNTSQIIPNSNVTPLGETTVSIQNSQISITKNKATNSPDLKKPVIAFTIDNGLVIATTGQMYSSINYYSIINPSTLDSTDVNSEKISPITSISVSSNGKSVAILGDYNSQKNTSNLYLQNLATKQNSLLLSNINYNTVKYLNENQLLVGYYSDSNEPNLNFNIFNIQDGKILGTIYKSSPKTTCNNSQIVAFYDFTSKSIKIINLTDLNTKEIKYTFPNLSTWLLCSDTNMYAISPLKDSTLTNKISITSLTSQMISTKLNQTIFIQPFISNNKLVIKTMNPKDKTYQLINID